MSTFKLKTIIPQSLISIKWFLYLLLKSLLSIMGLSFLIPQLSLYARDEYPNVLIIITDDLGWGEISLHGSTNKTPNIDNFFQEGLELKAHMVMPVCSPTRSALLTGRSPISTGITPRVINADNGVNMSGDEVTLGEAFSSAGYVTALIGKWHLGYNPRPNDQGFDLAYGNYGAACDYFTRMLRGYYDWHQNDTILKVKGYNTDLIGNRAVRFINENSDKPFFLYVAFTAPHNPLQAKEEDLKRAPFHMEPIYNCTEEERRIHAAMNIALDDEVGDILDALGDNNIEQNTIVLFISDNGATRSGNSLPLRGRKHSLYEGGIRTPAAIRWPGHIPGSRETNELIGVEDWYPTLLKMAGVTPPKGPSLDGIDISSVLIEGKPSPREFYSWIWNGYDAIRTKNWKLLRWNDKLELYNLVSDPYEENNLIKEKPGVAKQLESIMEGWYNEVGCYPSHIPMNFDNILRPEPSGNVVEIKASMQGGENSQNIIAYLGKSEFFQINPGDWMEYDMLVSDGSDSTGFYLDISQGTIPEQVIQTIPYESMREEKRSRPEETYRVSQTRENRLSFSDEFGVVDQYGVKQNLNSGFSQGSGKWARRAIGLGSLGPMNKSEVALLLNGKMKAEYHIYLDNIRIHRRNGKVMDFYINEDIGKIDESWNGGEQKILIRSIPFSGCRR